MSRYKIIVQYDGIYHFGSGGPYTFQVILNENGSILYQYMTMNSPTNEATVGIENSDASDGLQVAFNTDYIHNEMAILITSAP